MIETLLFETLLAGLHLWSDERKEEFVRRTISLKLEWWEEYEKPIFQRSDDRLVRIGIELRILADTFARAVKSQAT